MATSVPQEGYLVNYGARWRKGLLISGSIGERAVNEVVSLRMAKKQQMRWSDEGAHCLAQLYEAGPIPLANIGTSTGLRTQTRAIHEMSVLRSQKPGIHR